jgi:tetraacyldisaccharide 4'-kinase
VSTGSGTAKGLVRWWIEVANGRRAARGVGVGVFGLLVLLSVLYGMASALTQWWRSRRCVRLPVPVISVGNLVLGGTGKTPIVIHLARQLAERGRAVAIVSRGYGRLSRGLVVVSSGDRPLVGWEEAGDEPHLAALLTKGVRVVVADDRVAGARYAVDKLDADAILLDDGFQHVRLWRDADVLAVDASRPVGNGHLIPGGALREHPLGVGRADLIVVTRCGPEGVRRVERTLGALAPGTPLVETRMRPAEFWDVSTGRAVEASEVLDRRCLALSSIADPADFEATLVRLGIPLVKALAFPDHHRYTERDRAFITGEVRSSEAQIILTTEKDAIRLNAWRSPVRLVALGIEIEVLQGQSQMARVIDRALSSGGGHAS